MLRSYLLVRDHLEQARAILQIDEPDSRQLQQALQITIRLIDEIQQEFPRRASNVIAFPAAGIPPRSGK